MKVALQQGALVLVPAVLALWLLSVRLKNASIVDLFWGSGFVIMTWAALLSPTGPRAAMVAALVSLWGLRLSIHLGVRNLGEPEDRRYAAMRRKIGPRFWWVSLFTVFLFQGALIVLLSTAPIAALLSPAPLSALDVVAVLVFVAGLTIEAVADLQLRRFLRSPDSEGQVMDRGLWRYSRHPNYFGDALLWWGLGLFAVAAAEPWALFAPTLMTFLLLRVSGVLLMEKTIKKRRPEYEDYIRRTSAFVPWPPKARD